MPGPRANPNKPYSKYRSGARAPVTLPADGCDLPPPKLPSGRKWTPADRRTWRELWGSPQAVMWDDSVALLVAAFIVHTSAVLAGEATAWQAAESRHLADRLGLSPAGMASLGWRIAESGEVADVVPLRGVR